jgi:hypothetical protein
VHNGYPESNRVFNGDFESEPLAVPLDWRIESLDDKVEVTRDSGVAHTGSHSLRIVFTGKENVSYTDTSETAFVTSGLYSFEAFVRTEGITTDQGVGFHIYDPEEPSRVDIKTERMTGSRDWTKTQANVSVPPKTRLLEIHVIRESSLRFDSLISGTAWIDGVRLVKVR